MKKLYIKCTTDKYEFPVAVADTPGELANMLGVKVTTVRSNTSSGRNGYHRIELDDFIIPVCYPDNDGGLWYKDDETGRVIHVYD